MTMYEYQDHRFIIDDEEITFSEELDTDKHMIETKREDGTLLSRSAYKDGALHGPSTFYFRNGQIASEKWFVHGRAHGRALDFAPDATLVSHRRYKDGLLSGPFQKWRDNGKPLFSATFENGLAQGKIELLAKDGYALRTTHFSRGRRHGTDTGWTDDGYLLFCECWTEGQRTQAPLEDIFMRCLFPKKK